MDGIEEGTQSQESFDETSTEGTTPKYRIGESEYDEDTLRKALEDSSHKSEWQKAYTERDMSLAEERKSIARAKQLEEFFDKNPQAFPEVEGVFKKYNPDSGKMEPDVKFSKLEQELNGIKETLATKEAYQELTNELSALKEKNADDFRADPSLEQKVVSFAYENGIGSLKVAFNALMFDSKNIRAKEDGMIQGKKLAVNSRGLGSPSGSSGKAQSSNLKGTWNDTAERIASKYNG